MRHINGVYTQRFNNAHGLDGTLFRGRYKSIVVSEGNYLMQLVRYIHLNPVRSGMVERVGQYEWSGHKGYFKGSRKNKHTHLTCLFVRILRCDNARILQYAPIVAP